MRLNKQSQNSFPALLPLHHSVKTGHNQPAEDNLDGGQSPVGVQQAYQLPTFPSLQPWDKEDLVGEEEWLEYDAHHLGDSL